MNVQELDGWIPARIHWLQQGPAVEWRYLGRDRLTDPFFESSMRLLFDRPFRAVFGRTTPLEVLEERAALGGIPPTGFIFHLSRCGSTLIHRMLAASPANIALSEPGCIEDMAWAGAWLNIRGDVLARLLRALITVLGQPRSGETRYFIKFDSMQTVALPLIRMAFPTTPWIFVYRDPVEILVSIQRSCPVFATPGAAVGGYFPIPPREAALLDPDEYAARVLNLIASAAAGRIEQGDGMPVNYTELPAALFGRIPAHFGCTWEPAEIAAMEQAAQFQAKSPSRKFVPDAADKQREASPDLRRWADRWLSAVYQRLETARVSRSAGRP